MLKVVMIAFLGLFPHFVPLPFYSYAVVCLAVLIFYLRRQKKTLRDLGLKRDGLTADTFVIGILSSVVLDCF
jgi:hypothetical protein